MSRSRKINLNGTLHWFDIKQNNQKATDKQLELLTMVEDIEMEDLLESNLTQGDIIERLKEKLGQGVPYEVYQRRDKFRAERQVQPECRICGKVGDSTRHHFINKWILKELAFYADRWSNRKENTIPVCIDCHRDLHMRNNGPFSIVEYLTDEEKDFAERALAQLAEERPKLLILIAKGSPEVYEARLIQDWVLGKFQNSAEVG